MSANSSLRTAIASIVFHAVAQGILMFLVLVIIVGLRYLILAWAPQISYFAARILTWGAFAAVTSFVVSLVVSIVISFYRRPLNLSPENRSSLSTIVGSSYAAEFFTAFVVYALFYRATTTENPVAKSLIYLATIGLVFEIGLMAYIQIKRNLSTSVNQHPEGIEIT